MFLFLDFYVDLNEDQTRIMPGRPEKNMMEDEKGEGGKLKFDDENIVGDTTMARRRNYVKQILNMCLKLLSIIFIIHLELYKKTPGGRTDGAAFF